MHPTMWHLTFWARLLTKFVTGIVVVSWEQNLGDVVSDQVTTEHIAFATIKTHVIIIIILDTLLFKAALDCLLRHSGTTLKLFVSYSSY